MNVIIIYKWDYEADDAYVSSERILKWKRRKLIASDDDAAAITFARCYAQATGGKLRGVTIGNGDASWAMARGAESAFSYEDFFPEADDLATAVGICRAVEAAGKAEVVVIGDTIQRAGVAPVLAALLGLPLVASVRDFQVDTSDPDFIVAHRALESGIETIRFRVPVLVSVEAVDSEKDIPSMKQMLAARKLPVNKVQGTVEKREGFTILSSGNPQIKRARIFEGETDQAVAALVSTLRSDGVL